MASAAASRQCSKCKDTIGSFNCEGCKEIFCTKHSIEHRQELSTRYEQVMTEHNIILQQTQDKEQQKELFKKDLFCRIEDWEKNMVAKVHERAEQICQQLDELVDNKNKMVINNIQPSTDEIRQRYEKEDFLEHDIERIKENINRIEQEIDKSNQYCDIKLHVDSNDIIDWENLIYVIEKSNTTSSSVTNKQSAGKDSKGIENAMKSNTMQAPYVYTPPCYYPSPFVMPGPRGMNPSYTHIIRPPTENASATNIPSYEYQPLPSTASNSSTLIEKRPRKPLVIVDPVSHKVVEGTTVSSNMTSTTDRAEQQADFGGQVARLLNSNPNT